jgi:hypothetical protein
LILSYGSIGKRVGLSSNTVRRTLNPILRENSNSSIRNRRHLLKGSESDIRAKARHRNRWVHVRDNDGNSHYVKVIKRTYTGVCDMCHDQKCNHLYWHHWDDLYPELGLWLCALCHMFAEGIEQGRKVEVYLELKEWVKRNTGALVNSETPSVNSVI